MRDIVDVAAPEGLWVTTFNIPLAGLLSMFAHPTLLLPCFLIVSGTGWLLSSLGIVPEIDWIWTLGLAATGVMSVVLGGWNKLTFVSSLFFVAASGLSILRQTGLLAFNVEAPLLMILLGGLALGAHWRQIPSPVWGEAKSSMPREQLN